MVWSTFFPCSPVWQRRGGGLKLFGQCPYRTNTFQKGASLTVNEENCSTEILQTPLPLLTDVVVNRLVRTLICQSSHFGKGKKLIMYLSFYICSCWIRTLARPQARRGKNRPLWFFNSKSLYCSQSTPGRSPQAPYHRIVTNVQTTFAKKIFVEKDYGQNTNWLICMWTYLIPNASFIWI